MATERHSHVQSRDICVSAPTGSGKTLVFVLGVLQVITYSKVGVLYSFARLWRSVRNIVVHYFAVCRASLFVSFCVPTKHWQKPETNSAKYRSHNHNRISTSIPLSYQPFTSNRGLPWMSILGSIIRTFFVHGLLLAPAVVCTTADVELRCTC